MPNVPAWKRFETWVAKLFGDTRAPLSGGNGKQTRSDSLHPHFFISCKHTKNSHVTLFNLVKEESEKANAEGKIPVIAIGRAGRGKNRNEETLIVIKAGDLDRFCKQYVKDTCPIHSRRRCGLRRYTHATPYGEWYYIRDYLDS